MNLTADQRAMLQLLLERGQSYDDLASVLGVGVDEVRTRARAALTELADGADPDAEVGLTDYLLGQADPIGRADAVRHLQADPESHRLASELRDRLLEISPGANLPELPEPKGRRRAAAPSAPTRLRGTMTRRQQQTIIGLVAAAVLALVGILAVAGAFGGGDDAQPVADTQTTTGSPAEGDVLETVELRPRSGSDAMGEVTFGLASQDQPYVDISLTGLNPPSQGETYVVWLLLTDDQGYPLSPLEVSGEGEFSDRFAIPQPISLVASRARFVDISLSDNRSLATELGKAQQQQKLLLRYQGDSVLRGEIPAQAAPQGGGGASGGGAGGGGAGGG